MAHKEEHEAAPNFCPLADHYSKCPLFKKSCDAINCEANPHVKKALLNKAKRV